MQTYLSFSVRLLHTPKGTSRGSYQNLRGLSGVGGGLQFWSSCLSCTGLGPPGGKVTCECPPPPCGTPRRREGWPRPPPPRHVPRGLRLPSPERTSHAHRGPDRRRARPCPGPSSPTGAGVSCFLRGPPGGASGAGAAQHGCLPRPPHCPAGAAVAITHVRHVACESQRRSGTWTLGDARFPVPRQVRSLGQSQRAFNCSML